MLNQIQSNNLNCHCNNCYNKKIKTIINNMPKSVRHLANSAIKHWPDSVINSKYIEIISKSN